MVCKWKIRSGRFEVYWRGLTDVICDWTFLVQKIHNVLTIFGINSSQVVVLLLRRDALSSWPWVRKCCGTGIVIHKVGVAFGITVLLPSRW